MMFWLGLRAKPSKRGDDTDGDAPDVPTPPLESGISFPLAPIWKGRISLAPGTVSRGGGVKVSTNTRSDVGVVSTWEGESPRGSVVVAATFWFRVPSWAMLKTVMLGAI